MRVKYILPNTAWIGREYKCMGCYTGNGYFVFLGVPTHKEKFFEEGVDLEIDSLPLFVFPKELI